MKIHSYFIFIAFIQFLFITFGCKKDNQILNGEIKIISIPDSIKKLEGKKIELEDVTAGYMSAYDSLLVFVSSNFPDFWVHVFSSKTGSSLGKFVKKGRGPGELLDYFHTQQFIKENEEMKLWCCDALYQNIYLFNITQSINKQETVFDTIIPLNWRSIHSRGWGFFFLKDKDNIILQNSPEKLDISNEKVLLSNYYHFNKEIDNLINTYKLYNYCPILPDNTLNHDMLFYSLDRIKPDTRMIVEASLYLGQINILDLEIKNITGFRLEGTPDYKDVIKNSNKLTVYYTNISVSNNNIYCLYSNRILEGNVNPFAEIDVVHVYDWSGKIIYQIKLDQKVREISVDPIYNLMYGINDLEEIYRYTLN